jgi:hypothetical protein
MKSRCTLLCVKSVFHLEITNLLIWNICTVKFIVLEQVLEFSILCWVSLERGEAVPPAKPRLSVAGRSPGSLLGSFFSDQIAELARGAFYC